MAAAVVVQLALEWVRQAWAVPELGAERRREPSEVAPQRGRWAVDRRDRTTRPGMERLDRAIQAEMPSVSPEIPPMLRRA